MKNQVKVNKTQKYSDSQGEHIVCEGKLLLIKAINPDPENLWYNSTLNRYWLEPNPNLETYYGNPFYQVSPITISETEEIKKGDYIYDIQAKRIFKSLGENYNDNPFCFKILALPEHFSDKHLQAIVDGKMEDGDKVLVKCDILVKSLIDDLKKYKKWTIVSDFLATGLQGVERKNIIHLNQQNYISLYPTQKTIKDTYEEFFSTHSPSGFDTQMREYTYSEDDIEDAIKFGIEWVKNN